MRSVTLSSLLVPAGLADLAGVQSYARGAAYQSDGRVEVGAVGEGRVEAVVRGTMPYDVVLWVEGAELGWSCSCPVGEEGDFCKHCVAVGLVVGGTESGTERSRKKAARKGARREVDLRAYVGRLEVSELVDLVMEQADSDWRLRERLTARAVAESGAGIDERAWRRRLDAVFASDGGFVDYREAALTGYRRLLAEAEPAGALDAGEAALRALRKRVAEGRPADTGRLPQRRRPARPDPQTRPGSRRARAVRRAPHPGPGGPQTEAEPDGPPRREGLVASNALFRDAFGGVG